MLRISKLLLVLLFSSFATAQMVRVDQPILTTGPYVPFSGGPLPQALFVANATVTVCSHPAAMSGNTCTNTIATYTDSTGSTPCPSTAQLVPSPGESCTSDAGVAGNIGFWYVGGQVDAVITSAYGTFGPYTMGGGDGGGTAGLYGQVQQSQPNGSSIGISPGNSSTSFSYPFLNLFGDSITVGAGTATTGSGPSTVLANVYAYANRLCADIDSSGANCSNYGQSGDMAADMTRQIYGILNPQSTGNNPISTILCCTNDLYHGADDAGHLANATQELTAAAAWAGIASNFKIQGNNTAACTPSGTYTYDTYGNVNVINLESAGASLSCTTLTAAAPAMYVAWLAQHNSTAAAALNIDGGSSVTLNGFGHSGLDVGTFNNNFQTAVFANRFALTGSGTHTFTVTATTATTPSALLGATYLRGITAIGPPASACQLTFSNGATATLVINPVADTVLEGAPLTITAAGSAITPPLTVTSVAGTTNSYGTSDCTGTPAVIPYYNGPFTFAWEGSPTPVPGSELGSLTQNPPRIFMGGTVPQQANMNAQGTTDFNAQVQNVATALTGDGIMAPFVNVRAFIGLDQATPYGVASTITAWSVVSGTATITVPGTLAANQSVLISGLSVGSCLNGGHQVLTVASGSYTFATTCANGSVSESGTSQPVEDCDFNGIGVTLPNGDTCTASSAPGLHPGNPGHHKLANAFLASIQPTVAPEQAMNATTREVTSGNATVLPSDGTLIISSAPVATGGILGTSGTAVSQPSLGSCPGSNPCPGHDFTNLLVGGTIQVGGTLSTSNVCTGGTSYVIASITDSSDLVLTTSAGTNTNVSYCATANATVTFAGYTLPNQWLGVVYNKSNSNSITLVGATDNMPNTLLPQQSILVKAHDFASFSVVSEFVGPIPISNLTTFYGAGGGTVTGLTPYYLINGGGTITIPSTGPTATNVLNPTGEQTVLCYSASAACPVSGSVHNIPSSLSPGASMTLLYTSAGWEMTKSNGIGSITTLTTNGNSGPSSLSSGTLNIPIYSPLIPGPELTWPVESNTQFWILYPNTSSTNDIYISSLFNLNGGDDLQWYILNYDSATSTLPPVLDLAEGAPGAESFFSSGTNMAISSSPYWQAGVALTLGTSQQEAIGLLSSTFSFNVPAGNTPQVGFRHIQGTDTDWQCVTGNGAGTTIVDSGVVVDQNFHIYSVFYDAAGGTGAHYWIDGAQVCHIVTNVPSGTLSGAVGQAQVASSTGVPHMKVAWMYGQMYVSNDLPLTGGTVTGATLFTAPVAVQQTLTQGQTGVANPGIIAYDGIGGTQTMNFGYSGSAHSGYVWAPDVGATNAHRYLQYTVDQFAATPTYTAGTNVTSCAQASGYTNTNQRGEVTIVGGTATTGTVCTINFALSPAFAPGLCSMWQKGGASQYGIGHGVATTSGVTVTAEVSVSGATINVDYDCVP